ncbi:MAG: helix-turn-helix transcriptional regulator [Gammaproteobacteria bacterium]
MNVTSKSPISKRLKEARLEAGISQKQLGIAAGVDEFVASARLNQYETGKHVPDFAMMQKIAKVLKVSAAFFYAVDVELANLIKTYSKLSAKQQRQLIAFVKKIQE